MTDALLFAILTLASYRLWRIVGLDEWPPSKQFRAWLDGKTYHGDDVHPTYSRGWWWQELQTMVECPWCLGFWVSGAVVAVVDIWFVDLAMPVLWCLGVSCVVGLIGQVDG